MPAKLLAILPRGEAMRNFVHSGALQALRPEVAVSLATVEPSPEVAASLAATFDGYHSIGPVTEHRAVRLSRGLLEQAHGRHVWSEAAQERWRRRDAEVATAGDRVRRTAWKAAASLFASERGLAIASALERRVSRAFPPDGEADTILDAEAADLVFNASHIHSALAIPLVQAAGWRGIPTATFLFSWDNLTSQGRILDIYDHFLAWNHQIADDLIRMYPGIDPDQVPVTGTPQFDFHFHEANRWPRARWAEEVGVDPDRPVVLYTTGMANHMPGEPEIVAFIADRLAEMDDLGRPQLLVRVYAKDRTGRFDELRRQRPDIAFSPVHWLEHWLTPMPEDIPLWSSTLDQVACGINVASTVSLELAMFDKPVINVAFNPPSVPVTQIDYARYYRFDHYAPVVASGALSLAERPDDIAVLVRAALEEPSREAPGRARVLEQMFGDTLDGHSAARVATALRSWLDPKGARP